MANRWSGVTIDCTDPLRLSSLWGLCSTSVRRAITATTRTGRRSGHAQARHLGSPSSACRNRSPRRYASTSTCRSTTSRPDAAKSRTLADDGRVFGTNYDEGVVLVMLDLEGHEFCLVEYFERPVPDVEP